MKTIPMVWSNDDISAGQAPQLRRLLAFIEEYGIRGTFFVVPITGGGRPITDDRELLDVIADARDRGHEFQQHGTRHDAFECGVPETWMLDFSPPTRQRYDVERLSIEQGHTFEAQVRMLEEGRRVWREAFGEDSTGFRPGWGAFCGNFYRALDCLGYRWVSSRIVTRTAWFWNLGRWDAPVEFREDVPHRPGPIAGTGVIEIPMTGGEYSFNVPNEPDRIEAMVDLALQESQGCWQRDLPFVFLSHGHRLENNDDVGYAIHRRLLPALTETRRGTWQTLAEVFAAYTESAPTGDAK